MKLTALLCAQLRKPLQGCEKTGFLAVCRRGSRPPNTKNKDIRMDVLVLVRWKGLEPLTYWFVASHSIQLSYQRTAHDIYYHLKEVLSTPFLENFKNHASIFSRQAPQRSLP